jgi:hypothetical protein
MRVGFTMNKVVAASALLVACSKQPASPASPSPPTPPSSSAKPAALDARAEAFVTAWKGAKADKQTSLDAYLADHVTIRYRHAADEPAAAPQVVSRADASKRLIDDVEGFVIGDRQSCDARCCQFDTHFQRGDTKAAIASICLDNKLVTEVEAEQ